MIVTSESLVLPSQRLERKPAGTSSFSARHPTTSPGRFKPAVGLSLACYNAGMSEGSPIKPPRRPGRILKGAGFLLVVLGIGLNLYVEFAGAAVTDPHLLGLLGGLSVFIGIILFITGRLL